MPDTYRATSSAPPPPGTSSSPGGPPPPNGAPPPGRPPTPTTSSTPGPRVGAGRGGGVVPAGEGLLVNLGVHVAGVHHVYPRLGVLCREHVRELLERRLGRAVPAPALVGLNGGVGRDVHDPPARRHPWQGELHE